MKPDREEYSLNEVALMKAGIDPRECCNSVHYAIKKNLPGCHKAFLYLEQLIEQVESRQLQAVTYIEAEDGVLGSEDILISKEDAERWQPEDLPIKPVISEPNPDKPKTERDKRSTLLAFALLARHTGLYEKYNGQGRKGGQKAIAQLIRNTAEELDYSLQRLSMQTLQQLLKEAEDALIEQPKTTVVKSEI